jgi:hypothetical protein
MQSTIFNAPVLKVNSLKSKFDTNVLSNSFIALLGNNYIEARILQQLHYWCYSQYGVVIDGIRWIYKPLREWLSEALTGLTDWKVRKAIASLLAQGLIRREKLFVKHHQQVHNSPWWHPKNQTYYYSVNYDQLQKLIERAENRFEKAKKAETPENVRIEDSSKLSVEEFTDTKCCELSQNSTKNTSIENKSRDQSHPTLPCGCEEKTNLDSQETQDSSNSEPLNLIEPIFVAPPNMEKETSSDRVEENINQNKNTIRTNALLIKNSGTRGFNDDRKRTSKETGLTRKSKAPWKDEEEFKQFYRALIQALPLVANSHSPQGLAKTIIAQLKRGEEHTYWDDFKAGLPIGTSTKPEWEIEPGVPYPMFVEYLTEKIKRGDNTQTNEQARNEAFRIIYQPRQAMSFWGVFKRSVVNVSEQIERDRALGVSNPNTPVWTKERVEPSIEEATKAGDKIMAANGTAEAATLYPCGIEAAKTPQLENKSEPSTPDPWIIEESKPQLSMREMLANRGVKGFCKPMPKVSEYELAKEEREQTKPKTPKTNIAQMSVAEINDYLTDPIFRKQIMPQLWDSDYGLITDEVGQIIGVEPPPPVEE